jgi:hypothetical protein
MMTKTDGEKQLSTESKKDAFNDKLDMLLANLIIPTPKIANNIEDVLSLTYDQLKSISTDECSIFSYQLKQYAYYIQQKYNRFKNIEIWAKECMKIVFGQQADNYGTTYTKWEEKQAIIISGDSYAKKLHMIAMEYHCCAEELGQLSNRLLDMSKTLDNMVYNRGKNND